MKKYIDKLAVIEKGAIVYDNVHIIGNSFIGAGSIIYPNSIIINSSIGQKCIIKCSFIEGSQIENNVIVGPFANIRPESVINENCKIGNFVEVKNSIIKKNTKVSHLAYIGDCDIGEKCNIGCGVIFANFNGKIKNKTKVGDNCFIGSNSNIIAPIEIAKNTYICAGTTLTQNTEEDDFVIARSRETIKKQRAHKYLKEESL